MTVSSDVEHPEAECDDCDHPNLPQPWWTSSDRWRLACSMSGGTPAEPERDHILCPACFIARWEKATGLTAVWRLEPDPASIKAVGHDEWMAEHIRNHPLDDPKENP